MNWSQIKSIVAGALSRPESDRGAYLNAQCGADAAMRGEVESLLAAAIQAADLYEDPTVTIAGARITADALGNFTPATATFEAADPADGIPATTRPRTGN